MRGLMAGTAGTAVWLWLDSPAAPGAAGISLALIGQARGYRTLLTLPNNVSGSKIDKMKLLGAEVAVLELVPFSNPNHFYHVAQRLAQEQAGSGPTSSKTRPTGRRTTPPPVLRFSHKPVGN
eukprot:g14302.t1